MLKERGLVAGAPADLKTKVGVAVMNALGLLKFQPDITSFRAFWISAERPEGGKTLSSMPVFHPLLLNG